jgi:hypothetical protein
MTRVVLPARLDLPGPAGRSRPGTDRSAEGGRDQERTRPGPRWGRGPPDNQGRQRLATVSRSRRSAGVSEHSSRSSNHPDCLSHGGSQEFNSPHLHPTLMTSGNAGHRRVRGRPEGRITDGEFLIVLVLRHGQPRRSWLAAPLLRATPPAQNRSERTVGNYLESARLAEIFLEGGGKQLEEATQADPRRLPG